MPDPITEEMRLAQSEREHAERRMAAQARDEEDTATHERRADRAAYLRAKLAERARSEDDAEG